MTEEQDIVTDGQDEPVAQPGPEPEPIEQKGPEASEQGAIGDEPAAATDELAPEGAGEAGGPDEPGEPGEPIDPSDPRVTNNFFKSLSKDNEKARLMEFLKDLEKTSY